MKNYRLNQQALNELWLSHHSQRDKHIADRIKAVYLLGMGWTVERVATALLLSENSIRNYYESYTVGGLAKLKQTNYGNPSSYLREEQMKALEAHLQEVVYLRVEDIIRYVEKTFKVSYRPNGMRDLLHRLNFVYKKPKLIPAQPDSQAQQAFIKKYRKIQGKLGKDDRIYFMDATHPHYQTVTGYGWIKKGQEIKLRTTATQPCVNINGAINLATLKGVFHCKKESLTRLDTIDMLIALRKQQPKGWIYLISDRGGCYRAKEVKSFADSIGIKMIYLPPYSPNLNIIERLWLFFRKKVLYNKTYASFEEFYDKCQQFFKKIPAYEAELNTLLTDNFQVISV
jgi:transposase